MYQKHILIFNRLSNIYEKLGDEIRATAYHNLSKKLELSDTETVSEKSWKKIEEINETGTLKILSDFEKDKKIMARIKLTNIIGVGPKVAEKLVDDGITTFGQFKKLPNLTSLQQLGVKYYNKIDLPTASVFKSIMTVLKNGLDDLVKIEIAGSYRMGNRKPNDIDLIVCTKTGNINEVLDLLKDLDYVMSGENDILGIITVRGKFYRIDIKCVTPKYLHSYLLYFGSGKYFSKYIRGIAKEQGYKLNRYGIADLKTGDLKTFRSEKAIFKFLKVPYLTPEERKKYF